MPQILPFPQVRSVALRGAREAIHTAQTVGIEWMDLAKQGYDDALATTRQLMACRNPGEALALQGAFTQRAAERSLAQAKVLGDQVSASFGRLVPPGPRP
jgi:phasin family protein